MNLELLFRLVSLSVAARFVYSVASAGDFFFGSFEFLNVTNEAAK